MRPRLLVVGAGFAGLACARAAALSGMDVTVIEKKTRAGAKLHSTGILVKDAVDSIDWLQQVPPELVRRVEGVRLYAPSMCHVDLQAPGYYFWATDTPRLLDWMVDSVRQLGVDVRLGTLFENAAWDTGHWRVQLRGGEVMEAAYLVGADGPLSRVAKALGLSCNEHFLFGIEHEYAQGTMDENLLHCFIDRQLAPGYIGWAVAGVGVSQVGLARRMPPAAAGPGSRHVPIDAFLDKIAGVVQPAGEPASVRAGMIPCGGLLRHVARPGAMLVGDAAGMVSPVTAGGIHAALLHGAQVGKGISAYLSGHARDPSEWLVGKYPHFRTKLSLRWLFDNFQSDWIFNKMLETSAMRRVAELVYFHRKGSVRP